MSKFSWLVPSGHRQYVIEVADSWKKQVAAAGGKDVKAGKSASSVGGASSSTAGGSSSSKVDPNIAAALRVFGLQT